MTRLFQAERPNYANFTAQVVTSPSAADLLVYRSDDARSEAHGEGVWTFVDQRENAHVAVYLTPPGQGGAHVKICWVKVPSFAGWLRPHRLKGRLRTRMAALT